MLNKIAKIFGYEIEIKKIEIPFTDLSGIPTEGKHVWSHEHQTFQWVWLTKDASDSFHDYCNRIKEDEYYLGH